MQASGITHIGRRPNNEDSYRMERELGLFLVADGMGGYEGGEIASKLVVDTLAGTDQPGTFDIVGLAKDLGLALQLGQAEGADMPLSSSAQPRYAAALSAGLGGFDGASLTRRAAGK